MKTKKPVTLSGWYELEDGRVKYYFWKDGQLFDGAVVSSREKTAAADRGEFDECLMCAAPNGAPCYPNCECLDCRPFRIVRRNNEHGTH